MKVIVCLLIGWLVVVVVVVVVEAWGVWGRCFFCFSLCLFLFLIKFDNLAHSSCIPQEAKF